MEGKKKDSDAKENSSRKGSNNNNIRNITSILTLSREDEDEINAKDDNKALENAAVKIQAGWKGYKVRKDNKATPSTAAAVIM